MTISLASCTGPLDPVSGAAAEESAAADLTSKAAADSFPAGILSPPSAITARWALPFPFWEVGNLHSGSPAQCRIAPQRMHLDLALSDFNLSLRCSRVKWLRTTLPFPLPLPFLDLTLPRALPKAACAANCNCTAFPASEDSSSSSGQLRAMAFNSDSS